MIKIDYTDIHIERCQGTYTLFITDANEITAVKNLTKRQAIKLYGALVIQALEFGLMLSKKPVIITRPKNVDVKYAKPMTVYPISEEFTQWLSTQ